MTVLSLPLRVARLRRVARPRYRAAALPRHLDPARRPARTKRHVYSDPFFADPVAVEDDSRRMTRPGAAAR
jgi:hypothetical protein